MIVAKTENIEFTATNNEADILARIPFALKSEFRALFKTAKWNPARKVWVLKNTSITRNKAIKFCEKIAPVEKKAIEVAAAEDDNIDAQLKILDQKIEALKDSLSEKEEKLMDYKAKVLLLNQKETEVDALISKSSDIAAKIADEKANFSSII